MAEKETTEEEETEEDNGTRVVMPNIPGFTRKFNKIARDHRFKVANKAENKVRDLTTSAKTPLGDKNTNVIYRVFFYVVTFSKLRKIVSFSPLGKPLGWMKGIYVCLNKNCQTWLKFERFCSGASICYVPYFQIWKYF